MVRGTNTLELLRLDENARLVSVVSTNCFCVVRSIIPFRQIGTQKDYLVLGSDSGKVSILEFDVSRNSFQTVHCETFGKTGCRRIVPGQYLAADPMGRAIMIGESV